MSASELIKQIIDNIIIYYNEEEIIWKTRVSSILFNKLMELYIRAEIMYFRKIHDKYITGTISPFEVSIEYTKEQPYIHPVYDLPVMIINILEENMYNKIKGIIDNIPERITNEDKYLSFYT